MRFSRSSKAFTLLELIVVIVILGILAALAIPTFARVIERSRNEATLTSLQSIARGAQALNAFDATGVWAPDSAAVSIEETSAPDGGRLSAVLGSTVPADTSSVSYQVLSAAAAEFPGALVLAQLSSNGDLCLVASGVSSAPLASGCTSGFTPGSTFDPSDALNDVVTETPGGPSTPVTPPPTTPPVVTPPVEQPTTISNLNAAVNGTGMNVTWDPVANATSYNVQIAAERYTADYAGGAFMPDGTLVVSSYSLGLHLDFINPETGQVVSSYAAGAGNRDGAKDQALFSQAGYVQTDSAGNIYVFDGGNNSIRKIGTNGQVSTVVTQASGSTNAYEFNHFDVDDAGNVYTSKRDSNVIRVTSATGSVRSITTLHSAGDSVRRMAVTPGGDIYSIGYETLEIRPAVGTARIYGGYAAGCAPANGPLADAKFCMLRSVELDKSGNVYLTSSADNQTTYLQVVEGTNVRPVATYQGMIMDTPVAPSGKVFMMDSVGAKLAAVDPASGEVSTSGLSFLGDSSPWGPFNYTSTAANRSISGVFPDATLDYRWKVTVTPVFESGPGETSAPFTLERPALS